MKNYPINKALEGSNLPSSESKNLNNLRSSNAFRAAVLAVLVGSGCEGSELYRPLFSPRDVDVTDTNLDETDSETVVDTVTETVDDLDSQITEILETVEDSEVLEVEVAEETLEVDSDAVETVEETTEETFEDAETMEDVDLIEEVETLEDTSVDTVELDTEETETAEDVTSLDVDGEDGGEVCVTPEEYCGDGVCTVDLEDCVTCAMDCNVCEVEVVCGDGVCDVDSGERCFSQFAPTEQDLADGITRCLDDCGECQLIECGDNFCDKEADKNGLLESNILTGAINCAADCGDAPGEGRCGNDSCSSAEEEDCQTCLTDCGSCTPADACGDGTCEPLRGEDADVCFEDCGVALPVEPCGDGLCDDEEDCDSCPSDCGASCPMCAPSE